MHFHKQYAQTFESLFSLYSSQIAGFKGCLSLTMLKAVDIENVYFTYSVWESENDLNEYRQSKLFQEVWPQTKVLFQSPAEAWSCQSLFDKSK